MSNWNDDRLDEFSRRTDESFGELRAEMREGFAQVDQSFGKVDQRFEKVDREFKDVRAEIKEVRGEIHRLTNTLLAAGAVVTASIIGTGILS